MAKIGYALKSLRLRRQLSMRELALRSGVSHTTISMMERDAISPTIDTLQAVLDALGSRLAEFLGGVRQGAGSPFYPAEDMPEIGNPDTISYRLIGLNHPYRSFQFLRESYAVGADTGEMLSHARRKLICGEGSGRGNGRRRQRAASRRWILFRQPRPSRVSQYRRRACRGHQCDLSTLLLSRFCRIAPVSWAGTSGGRFCREKERTINNPDDKIDCGEDVMAKDRFSCPRHAGKALIPTEESRG